VLQSPQMNALAFTGTNTLTAYNAGGCKIADFDASANNVTVTAVSPLTGAVSGLHGSNVLNQAGDFSNGVADLTALGITYTGNAATSTFLATSANGKSGTSNPVTIAPGILIPAFSAQPGPAKVSTTIYHDPATSAFVTVSVADISGNKAPDGTTVTMTGPAGLQGHTSRTTTGGVATFDDLSLGAIGTYQLTAQVTTTTPTGAVARTATSDPFQVVSDLAVCTGNSCHVTGKNAGENSDATITAGGTAFQSVVFTTTFTAAPNGCDPTQFSQIPGTIGNVVETVSGNLTQSQPTFTITYTIQKSVLKAANLDKLGASQFDVCLGAKRLDGGTDGWIDKFGNTTTADPTGTHWGVVPNASNQLPLTNPFVAQKKKDGAGDLIIVLVVPFPWDPAGYV
jgi:hypothetical protein